ncbi:MAG: ATP-binding protein, partial [Limnochordia bacterium]|nr:ATP-binding protein [Limnochordia bacterium]
VIITSNLNFGDWNRIFCDDRLTAALIDRLIHHSHILAFEGPRGVFSYWWEKSWSSTLLPPITKYAHFNI